jgi:hypothetical protein
MAELRSRYSHAGHPFPGLFSRAEPDDLYDPPPETEFPEPFLVDPAEDVLDDIDIYGLDDYDEDDED